MRTKVCIGCGIEKDVETGYYKDKSKPDDYVRPKCKECMKAEGKKNKDQKNARLRQRYQGDPEYREKVLARNEEYQSTDAGKKAGARASKNHYESNAEEILAGSRERYHANPEHEKTRGAKYRKENKDEIRERRKLKARESRKSDPAFRLRSNISRQIRRALKENGSSKNGESVATYLGYTGDELREHIEKQFEPWMNWDNQGFYDPKTWNDNDPATWKWQLDHIIPQADLPFKSMKSKNFKKCWGLKNLRPLSAKENFLLGIEVLKRKKAARGNK